MAERRVLGFLGAHAPLVATAVAFAVVASRALSVAHGDRTTAAVLLTSLSIAQALSVIVVDLASIVGTLLVGVAGARFLVELRARPPNGRLPGGAIFAATLAVAVFVVPLPLLLLGLLIAAVNGVLARRIERVMDRTPTSAVPAVMVLCATVVVAWLLLHSDQPWLPPEVLGGGAAPTVGYVIAEDDRWTTVLTHDDRLVVRLRTEDVATRAPCLAQVPPPPPIWWLWADETDHPACPPG